VSELEMENERLRRGNNEVGRLEATIREYENRLALTSQEIERLNLMVKSKLAEISDSEQQTRRSSLEATDYKQRLKVVTDENSSLRRNLQELEGRLETSSGELTLRFNSELETLRRSLS
jgi:chromosome segregation ATPase